MESFGSGDAEVMFIDGTDAEYPLRLRPLPPSACPEVFEADADSLGDSLISPEGSVAPLALLPKK